MSARARFGSRPAVGPRRLPLVGVAVLATAVLAGPPISRATPSGSEDPESRLAQQPAAASGAVTIRVAFDAAGRGTFTVQGAISDAGVARVGLAVANRRARLTATLRGTSGAFVVRVDQTCGTARGTWRVLEGSGAYAGLSGGGRATGRIACTARRTPGRGVYSGAVRLPTPPPLATPGDYAGWTRQNERVSFQVLPDGRRVANVRVERLVATCRPELEVVLEPAFPAAYPLAGDGTFSITFAGTTIEGRLGGSGAAGTISYTSSEGDPFACASGSVGWTATSPPPPLPRALPGSYCGSTTQARSLCLRLAADGRITYLRMELRLECVRPELRQFDVETGFGGRLPLRSNLSFEVQGSLGEVPVPPEEERVLVAAGEYVLSGTFDSVGGVSGTLSLQRASFDEDGRLFTCRNITVGWRAQRLT